MMIDELARRITHWQAIEISAARLLGEWIPTAEPLSLRSLMAAWARNFTWHAELWAERLPVVPGADWSPSNSNASSAHLVVDAVVSPAAAVQILLDEVWDRLIDELRTAAAGIDPRLDGPTHRTIELVLVDLEQDRQQAHSVVSTA